MKKFFALTLALVCAAGLSLGCKPASTEKAPAADAAATEKAPAADAAATEKAPAADALEVPAE